MRKKKKDSVDIDEAIKEVDQKLKNTGTLLKEYFDDKHLMEGINEELMRDKHYIDDKQMVFITRTEYTERFDTMLEAKRREDGKSDSERQPETH